MAPKKKAEKQMLFSEVEKQFYELELADCNRRIAKLRQTKTEYEQRYEDLEKAYNKMDEDKGDIIEYLKKRLNAINDECSELKDKVKGLEELRDTEKVQFNKKIAELEKNFTTMKDQLSSENKLLSGKLNTLEEFRAIKTDLMSKFDDQQKAFEDQEIKYKRKLYDTEKKFILGKDRLKCEMEGKLLQLAQDFQDASELRIAASTHRVIRENIALNNQLDSLLLTQARIAEQNEYFKADEKSARICKEMAEEERDKAINKSVLQLKVIDRLTKAYEELKRQQGLNDKRLEDYERIQQKLDTFMKENESLTLKVRILEQNLHCTMSEQNKILLDKSRLVNERDNLKKILVDGELACLNALKLIKWRMAHADRDEIEQIDAQDFIHGILSTIVVHRHRRKAESSESLISMSNIYEKGDLGFIPKAIVSKMGVKKGSLPVSSSYESYVPLKDGSSSESTITPTESAATVKTLPSIQVMSPSAKGEVLSPRSVTSLASIASVHSRSTSSSSSASGVATTDGMESKLLQSKLAIQKSLMQDLVLSQAAFKSGSKLKLSKPSLVKAATSRESITQMPEKKSVGFLAEEDASLQQSDDKSDEHEAGGRKSSVVFKETTIILGPPDEQTQQGADSPTNK